MSESVLVDRRLYEADIAKHRKALEALGVRYQEVGKKYVLERRLSINLQNKVDQLISIIKQLERKQKPLIDNTPLPVNDDLLNLYKTTFNITEAEIQSYVASKTTVADAVLAKYSL